MDRFAINQLREWKQKIDKKPLIVNGARQTGKTWLLKEFGAKEYSNFVYFNCDSNHILRDAFKDGYEIKTLISNFEAICAQPISPNDTLIILDEIQEIPEALTSLKYFCESETKYNIVAAGSLLGLSLHSGTGFPVGKVEILELYPMTFFEFVLAVKGHNLFDKISNESLDNFESFHTLLIQLLRQYYFTGGMPEAVNAFVQGKSPVEIRTIQKAILYSYEKDISKHSSLKDIQRIHQVWESIPMQLAKENKRFIYGAIKSGARAKDFELAIQWLIDAGLVYKVTRIKKPCIPLKFYEDFNSFKLFLLDCGLMGAMIDAPIDKILIGSDIFEEYKGAFTELYVFQQIKANAATENLGIYYFSADDSKQELDFLLQKESTIIPIEVKAEENLRAKSLRQFVLDNPETHGIRFSMSAYRKQDWMTNIPLYLVDRI